jgi:hypothetical protein
MNVHTSVVVVVIVAAGAGGVVIVVMVGNDVMVFNELKVNKQCVYNVCKTHTMYLKCTNTHIHTYAHLSIIQLRKYGYLGDRWKVVIVSQT